MHRIFTCFVAIFSVGLSANLLADDDGDSADGMTARQVAEQYMEQEGAEAAFRNMYVDKLGQAHVRFDQVHEGVPVFAGQTIVHVGSKSEKVIRVTNARREVGPVEMKPSLSARAAERAAAAS